MKNNIDWVSVGKRIVSLRTINNMSRDRDRRIIRRKEKEEDFLKRNFFCFFSFYNFSLICIYSYSYSYSYSSCGLSMEVPWMSIIEVHGRVRGSPWNFVKLTNY